MTWNAHNPQGFASRQIRWEIVPYTRGRGLDLGCGVAKAFDHFTGIDSGHHEMFGQVIKPDIKGDATDLSIFATESLDFSFSSHLLEHFDYARVPDILREWMRVVKVGGHLVLYLPDKALYPTIGEPGSNPDHKWDPDYDSVVNAAMKLECGWDLIDYQLRDQGEEFSGLYVFKKLS